ncbi:MAG: hypothetical protein Kow00124_20450 [Anaerolineae bacterium]
MQTRIFISHSRRDLDTAAWLAARLYAYGADVVLDLQPAGEGQPYTRRVSQEIEASDALLLLLSPHALESQRVQLELARAINARKPIVAGLLEPVALHDSPFLASLAPVDLTDVADGGDTEAAVQRLAAALGLPSEPIRPETPPLDAALLDAAAAEADDIGQPTLDPGDVSTLLTGAGNLELVDPEGALFIYRVCSDLAGPDRQRELLELIRSRERRLLPLRLERLQQRAEEALRGREWDRAGQLAAYILSLNPQNSAARRIAETSSQGSRCDAVYREAQQAAGHGRWDEVVALAAEVRASCPEYGDPAGILLIQRETVPYLQEQTALYGHIAPIRSLAFSPDGALLASASADATIRLWEMTACREFAVLRGHSQGVNRALFSPDGTRLASASEDGTVRIWNIAEGVEAISPLAHRGEVITLDFSPDGSFLATTAVDNTLRLWHVLRGYRLATFQGYARPVQALAFAPDGDLIALASDYRILKSYMLTVRGDTTVLQAHDESVTTLTFTPDGRWLASASHDHTVRLWEMPAGDLISKLEGHTASVQDVSLCPAGQLLASASLDGTVRLWDMETFHTLAALRSTGGPVTAVAFSPSGRTLAFASADGVIHLWGVG